MARNSLKKNIVFYRPTSKTMLDAIKKAPEHSVIYWDEGYIAEMQFNHDIIKLRQEHQSKGGRKKLALKFAEAFEAISKMHYPKPTIVLTDVKDVPLSRKAQLHKQLHEALTAQYKAHI